MKRGIVLLGAALVIIGLLLYQTQSMKRMYRKLTGAQLVRSGRAASAVLTEGDIRHLPEPVQKYLRYVGAVGRPKVRNVRMAFAGEMKLDLDQDWTRIKTEQYNFLDEPTRYFYIEGSKAGLPFVGLDSYSRGKGNMLIKVASILPVADAKGPEMNQSALVTLLNDICLDSPAALIDPRFSWQTLDRFTVKVTMADRGRKVSGILKFNGEGQLINFITDDRYLSPTGKTYRKVRWSTPVRNYGEFHGVKVPEYAEAIWHLPEGDLCYARFHLKEFRLNVEDIQ